MRTSSPRVPSRLLVACFQGRVRRERHVGSQLHPLQRHLEFVRQQHGYSVLLRIPMRQLRRRTTGSVSLALQNIHATTRQARGQLISHAHSCSACFCFASFVCVRAWAYWLKQGVVSGGHYGDTTSCAPYQIRPCEHGSAAGLRPTCTGEGGPTPYCTRTCQQSSGKQWYQDQENGFSAYRVGQGEAHARVSAVLMFARRG